jgi:pimeloyl-ACP methyl ester carboxylesterase
VSDDLLGHRIAGAGEVVLLLNGGMMTLGAWDEVAASLEARFRVLRCDFRGQLLSPGPVPPTLEGQVDEVVRLLDALGIDRVHALGASFGAEVGLILAALRPDRVASLAAITATERLTPGMREDLRALRALCREAIAGRDRGRVFDAIAPTTFGPAYAAANAGLLAGRRKLFASLPEGWFAGLDALLAALEQLDLQPYLGRIRCRTLVVAAAQDAIFPVEHSRALAGMIPGAALAVVEGSGHALIVEKPRELATTLARFLGAAPQEEVRP